VLVTAAFEAGARATARARGFAALPILVFDADLEERDEDERRAAFVARLPELRAALARR
jgi:hypothetical protein